MSNFFVTIYPERDFEIWIEGLRGTGKREARHPADAVFSLGAKAALYVRAGGRDVSFGGTEYVLGLSPCEQMFGQNSGGTHKNACAGQKAAIVSGVIIPGLDGKGRGRKTANGMMKNGDYFQFLSEDATEAGCAEYMKERGASFMLMQDDAEDGGVSGSAVCVRRRQ